MATAPLAADPKAKPASKLQPVLPEERFWIRYSPHHEMPLSGLSSFAIHALIIGFLILWAAYLASILKPRPDRLPVEPVRFASGGGGGIKGGTSTGPGSQGALPQENLGKEQGKQPDNPDLIKTPLVQLTEAEVSRLPFKEDPIAKRLIQRGDNEFMKAFASLDQQAQNSLRRGVNGSPGQGGTGTGGGKGSGHDKGVGAGTGSGQQATLSQREKRMLRWKMIFDTRSGQDYLSQLHGLDAILAIPVGRKPNGEIHYKIIRDLKSRPAKLLEEDLDKIQRIYWFDTRPDSVASLAQALGLRQAPPHIVAFIPKELEDKLFKMELEYKGRTEQQIEAGNYATEFKVRPVGGGKLEPYVIAQEPRPERQP
jgi:hypothetical protein